MSIDFSKILSRTSADVPKPTALPVGDYPGIIKSWKTGEKNRNQVRGCTIVSILLGFTDWPDGVEPDPMINLANKQMSTDVYVTDEGGDDQTYRLFALADSCGIDTTDRPLQEILPELIGQPVLIAITHYINKNTGEAQAQVNKVVGMPN